MEEAVSLNAPLRQGHYKINMGVWYFPRRKPHVNDIRNCVVTVAALGYSDADIGPLNGCVCVCAYICLILEKV